MAGWTYCWLIVFQFMGKPVAALGRTFGVVCRARYGRVASALMPARDKEFSSKLTEYARVLAESQTVPGMTLY